MHVEYWHALCVCFSDPYTGFTKGGLHFKSSSYPSVITHAITIIQIVVEGLILIKHNMQFMSGHVTNIRIYTKLYNIGTTACFHFNV